MRWTAGALVVLVGCAHAPERPASRRQSPLVESSRFIAEGMASFYGPGLEGRPTASGERFDSSRFTAAHRTLPFGTCVRVLNVENDRAVEVRVNDRGPYAHHRLIDVSLAAARRLGMVERGVVRVRLFACR